jgi:hypothetical protein
MLRKKSVTDFYNKEEKRLKVKVREAYNRRTLGNPYREELKPLLKQLLLALKNAQELFLRSILKNEGMGWTEFYKYAKKRKGRYYCDRSCKLMAHH